MKLRYPLIAGALAAALAYPAFADLNYTQGAGTVLFDFVCFSTKHCPVHVPINSSGTEIMTAAAPAQVSLANTGANSTAVKVDNSAVTQPVSAASGAIASGAVASGAVAAGALASGAGVDGWDLTQGAKADSAWVSGSGSVIAILKNIANGVGAAIPTGTNTIGNVGSDPSSGGATPAFAFLALPATTTTQIVALSGSTKTYVTSLMALAGGTVNVTFKYGTGSNFGTGTTTLAGPYPLTAQAGFSQGAGTGAVMIVPAGQALCITTDATTSGGVHLTYQQK